MGWQQPPDGMAAWLEDHPGAEVWTDERHWHGAVPLGGSRLTTGPVVRGKLPGAMAALAASAAACLAVEADRPGWVTWTTQGRWTATREAAGRLLTVMGGSEAGLRERIAEAEARMAGTGRRP